MNKDPDLLDADGLGHLYEEVRRGLNVTPDAAGGAPSVPSIGDRIRNAQKAVRARREAQD